MAASAALVSDVFSPSAAAPVTAKLSIASDNSLASFVPSVESAPVNNYRERSAHAIHIYIEQLDEITNKNSFSKYLFDM